MFAANARVAADRSVSGFGEFEFKPLSYINVITGFNNSGKTSVLEALYLLFATKEQLQLCPVAFRSAQGDASERYEHFWRWLLPGGEFSEEASVFAETDDKKRLGLKLRRAVQAPNRPTQPDGLAFQFLDSSRSNSTLSLSPGGQLGNLAPRPWPRMQFFSPKFSDPAVDAEMYNQVQLIGGGEEQLFELMKVVDPRLRKLRYAKITKQPLVYADLGLRSLIPASQMGQAFCRMLTL